MGFLGRLFGASSGADPEPVPQRPVGADCRDTVIVVGTEYRRDAVQAAVDRMAGAETTALLEAEPTNPHDSKAIRVLMYGQPVGYLSQHQACKYQPAVALAAQHGEVIAVRAFSEPVLDPRIGPYLKLRLPDPKPLVGELEAVYAEASHPTSASTPTRRR